MIKPRVEPVNEPRYFEPHELFFSLTDAQGRIRYGNQVFTRVSGYEEEELVGQPHNIIRHPDMPRCVFKLLWDYLEDNKTIAAYVKNLAADGRYYWVLAAVTPCGEDYLSVRLNPSSDFFAAAKDLYAKTLSFESRAEEELGVKGAIKKSILYLSESLAELGYDNYDDFMRAALCAELEQRNQLLGSNASGLSHSPCGSSDNSLGQLLSYSESINRHLGEVFGSLDIFEQLSQRLTDKQLAVEELGPSLSFLALNTHVSASRMGEEGAVLSVVSRSLSERSKEADRLIATLMKKMAPICNTARGVAFDVAVGVLEAQICGSFSRELIDNQSIGGDLIEESLNQLIGEMACRIQLVLGALDDLRCDVQVLTQAAQDLIGQVEQMKTAQLNGKIEIASHKNAQGFAAIFEDVATIVHDARQDCDEIISVLENTGEQLGSMQRVESDLGNECVGIASLASNLSTRPAAILA